MADDNLPKYDDVPVEDELDDVHNAIDAYEPRAGDDELTTPESLGTVLTKYRVEAEIPLHQRKAFAANKAFHGRHVALSNTKRIDNLRHLDAQDLCHIYERIPTLRHRATQIRMRETGEFQMCRSNPEIGGFEAKIGVTNIRREDVDVRQSQSLFNNPAQKKRRSGILGFLGRRK